jgi:hypothetical protein
MKMSGALRPLVAAGSSAVVVAGVFAGGYALMTAGAGTAALAGEQGSGTATASGTAGTAGTAGTLTGRPTDTHGFQVSSARNHGQQGALQRTAHAKAQPTATATPSADSVTGTDDGSATETPAKTDSTRPTGTHGYQVSSARNHGQQGAHQRAAHVNAAPKTDADGSHGSTVSGARNHGQQGNRQRAAHAKQHHGDDHGGDKSAAGAPRHEGDG